MLFGNRITDNMVLWCANQNASDAAVGPEWIENK
jgi:hypothetical protein